MKNFKKVFIENKAWHDEVQMYLEGLRRKRNERIFETQGREIDGFTVTVTVAVAIAGFILGALIF